MAEVKYLLPLVGVADLLTLFLLPAVAVAAAALLHLPEHHFVAAIVSLAT